MYANAPGRRGRLSACSNFVFVFVFVFVLRSLYTLERVCASMCVRKSVRGDRDICSTVDKDIRVRRISRVRGMGRTDGREAVGVGVDTWTQT